MQDELWPRLNRKADEVKRGPVELELLAEWVRGIGTAEQMGLLVQQSVGRLFVETFTATDLSQAICNRINDPVSHAMLGVALCSAESVQGRISCCKSCYRETLSLELQKSPENWEQLLMP
jgi:hypothetical protein